MGIVMVKYLYYFVKMMQEKMDKLVNKLKNEYKSLNFIYVPLVDEIETIIFSKSIKVIGEPCICKTEDKCL